jgi:3-hydroxyacyl-CoA dehydrogenase
MKIGTIAIIGSGLIGRAWAITFARAGRAVRVYDSDATARDAALGTIETLLADLETYDLLNGASAQAVMARISGASSLEAALDGADYVQECTPENLSLKKDVFGALDAAAAPQTLLASSTSALLPSRFTERLKGRARCLVVHPINPPYLVPAVEVVPAPWTDPKVVAAVAAFMREVGQSPIVMKKEIDGFVMNRLQGALLKEAFRLVADGYASTEDVDIGIRDGLGLRWAFMGPYETIDLNAPGGVRDYIARYGPLFDNLWSTQTGEVTWSGAMIDQFEAERCEQLPRDELAARQRWRDRRLMALLAHKKAAARNVGD